MNVSSSDRAALDEAYALYRREGGTGTASEWFGNVSGNYSPNSTQSLGQYAKAQAEGGQAISEPWNDPGRGFRANERQGLEAAYREYRADGGTIDATSWLNNVQNKYDRRLPAQRNMPIGEFAKQNQPTIGVPSERVDVSARLDASQPALTREEGQIRMFMRQKAEIFENQIKPSFETNPIRDKNGKPLVWYDSDKNVLMVDSRAYLESADPRMNAVRDHVTKTYNMEVKSENVRIVLSDRVPDDLDPKTMTRRDATGKLQDWNPTAEERAAGLTTPEKLAKRRNWGELTVNLLRDGVIPREIVDYYGLHGVPTPAPKRITRTEAVNSLMGSPYPATDIPSGRPTTTRSMLNPGVTINLAETDFARFPDGSFFIPGKTARTTGLMQRGPGVEQFVRDANTARVFTGIGVSAIGIGTGAYFGSRNAELGRELQRLTSTEPADITQTVAKADQALNNIGRRRSELAKQDPSLSTAAIRSGSSKSAASQEYSELNLNQADLIDKQIAALKFKAAAYGREIDRLATAEGENGGVVSNTLSAKKDETTKQIAALETEKRALMKATTDTLAKADAQGETNESQALTREGLNRQDRGQLQTALNQAQSDFGLANTNANRERGVVESLEKEICDTQKQLADAEKEASNEEKREFDARKGEYNKLVNDIAGAEVKPDADGFAAFPAKLNVRFQLSDDMRKYILDSAPGANAAEQRMNAARQLNGEMLLTPGQQRGLEDIGKRTASDAGKTQRERLMAPYKSKLDELGNAQAELRNARERLTGRERDLETARELLGTAREAVETFDAKKGTPSPPSPSQSPTR